MATERGRKVVVFGLSGFGLVVALLALLAGVAAPQSGDTPGYEQLISGHSGLCLSVEGSSVDSGARIVQARCHGGDNQLWTRLAAADGYVRFQVKHSGKCLDVSGSSTINGAVIHQWGCHTNTNQQWLVETAGGQEFALRARHSSRCVDVDNGSYEVGHIIHQWGCHGRENQRWRSAPTVVDGSKGAWGNVIDTPLVSVAASVLKSGNVLLWSSDSTTSFGGGGRTQTAIFDPRSNQSSGRTVSNTGHDMFCPGISNLPDGRVLVNGGVNSVETSIYDEASGTWQDAADMNIGRGYQGTVQLSDGSTFTFGGSWSGGIGGKTAEVYNDGTWTLRPGIQPSQIVTNDAQGAYRSDNHLWLFTWSNNRLFHAGPSRNMHWIDTNGNGSITRAGLRGTDGDAMNGTAMMYEPGKILTVGGAPSYNNSEATASANIIDITGSAPQVRQIESLASARTLHHGVVLPSGEVLIVGGMERARLFHDERAVMVPELFDPDTETFSELAPMSVARTYHSVALLLPDATVLTGGGGLCGSCEWNHQDVQIYEPPYLFGADGARASRPVIQSAPSEAYHDQRISVTTNREVQEFALVRMASSTHSVNNDQRRIPLNATASNATTYTMQIPADAGIAVPGVWMLFAFDGNGVPSVAKMVTVGPNPNPNRAPDAVNDDVDVVEGGPAATVNVLANDSDPDGHTLAVSGVNAAGVTVGSVSFADGTITYQPPAEGDALTPGETVTDTFVYTVVDDFGAEDTAVVTVTITGAADPDPSVEQRFSEQFTSSNPSGAWSYRWNETSQLGDPSGYSPLLWNGFQFDSDGLLGAQSGDGFDFGLVAAWGVHPGPAAGQGGSSIDRYAIIGYELDRPGVYSIVSSTLSNRGCLSAGVDVIVLVNDQPVKTSRNRTSGSFDVALGTRAVGDVIEVALGPGLSSVCDAYDLDFTITDRSVAPPEPEPFVDQVFGQQLRPSNPSGNWSYHWNETSAVGDLTGYAPLLWNGFQFDSDALPGGLSGDGFEYGLIASWGIHPGHGAGQGGSADDRHAIIRFGVDQDGPYSIADSWFADVGCASADGIDVVVMVNDAFVAIVTGATGGGFDRSLGTLNAGDTIDVAFGPGGSNVCDAFTVDFTIAGR